MSSIIDKMAHLAGLSYKGDDGWQTVPSMPGDNPMFRVISPITLTAAAEVDMPYHVTQDAEGCDGWAVVKDSDGEIMGCHATEAEANDQMAALYANEADASMALDGAKPPFQEGEQWRAVVAPEGIESGDFPRREFAPGSLTTRDLPLPLRWVEQDVGFHDGAVVAGSMTRQTRQGGMVWAFGHWDTSEDAIEARRRVKTGMQRWVSVDADDIEEADVELIFPPDAEVDDELGVIFAMPEKELYHHARIAALTIVQIPAFQEAVIEDIEMENPAATGDPEDPSLVAASFPVEPPADWFQDPKLPGPTPFTVDDSGRVFGHLATWGTCHTSVQGACTTPPHEDEHAYYRLGEIACAGGERIPVGQITMGTGHAGAHLKQLAAAEHYDQTGTCIADVVTGNDQYGIWVAGAARPGLSGEQLRAVRAAKLSGDWRSFAGKLRLVAALCVNVPGFPIPRMSLAMAKAKQVSLVASGVVTVSQTSNRHPNIDLLAERVAASIGRDTKSRINELAARLGR